MTFAPLVHIIPHKSLHFAIEPRLCQGPVTTHRSRRNGQSLSGLPDRHTDKAPAFYYPTGSPVHLLQPLECLVKDKENLGALIRSGYGTPK